MKHILLLLALLSTGAHAEKVYRCGSVFSQQPCGADAKVTEIATGTPGGVRKLQDTATDATKQRSQEMCKSAVVGQLKDPESARFASIARGIPLERPMPAPGGPMTKTVSYSGYVNAKNAMGGYTGDKMFGCTLNFAETEVLEVSVLR